MTWFHHAGMNQNTNVAQMFWRWNFQTGVAMMQKHLAVHSRGDQIQSVCCRDFWGLTSYWFPGTADGWRDVRALLKCHAGQILRLPWTVWHWDTMAHRHRINYILRRFYTKVHECPFFTDTHLQIFERQLRDKVEGWINFLSNMFFLYCHSLSLHNTIVKESQHRTTEGQIQNRM